MINIWKISKNLVQAFLMLQFLMNGMKIYYKMNLEKSEYFNCARTIMHIYELQWFSKNIAYWYVALKAPTFSQGSERCSPLSFRFDKIDILFGMFKKVFDKPLTNESSMLLDHRANIIKRAGMLPGRIGRKIIPADNLKSLLYWRIPRTC